MSGIECVRCGAVPDQCSLLLLAINANGARLWNHTLDGTTNNLVIFADTGTRQSSYPITSLTLSVLRDITAARLELVFRLRNTDCGQDPTAAVALSVLPPVPHDPITAISIPTKAVVLGEGALQPLLVNYFVSSLVSQSSVTAGSRNRLTVSFASKAPLAAGTVLVLTGAPQPCQMLRSCCMRPWCCQVLLYLSRCSDITRRSSSIIYFANQACCSWSMLGFSLASLCMCTWTCSRGWLDIWCN